MTPTPRQKEIATALRKNGKKILTRLRSAFTGCYYQLLIADQEKLLNRMDSLALYLDAPEHADPAADLLAAQEAAGILTRYGADLTKLQAYLNEL